MLRFGGFGTTLFVSLLKYYFTNCKVSYKIESALRLSQDKIVVQTSFQCHSTFLPIRVDSEVSISFILMKNSEVCKFNLL